MIVERLKLQRNKIQVGFRRFHKRIKRCFHRAESSSQVSTLRLAVYIASAIVALNGAVKIIGNWYDSNIGWKTVEQNKIDKLAVLETTDYISSILGMPQLKIKWASDLNKYIYQEHGYWVVAYADKTDTVQHLLFTSCGDKDFNPVIKKNPAGPAVTLGKTTFREAFYERDVENHNGYKPHYFQRGATAPSLFIDEIYEGNPSNYQNVYSGAVEYCGTPKLPPKVLDTLLKTSVFNKSKTAGLQKSDFDTLRRKALINTFGISAPYAESLFTDDHGIDPTISYVNAGVLDSCSLSQDEYDDINKNIMKFNSLYSDQAQTKDYAPIKLARNTCK